MGTFPHQLRGFLDLDEPAQLKSERLSLWRKVENRSIDQTSVLTWTESFPAGMFPSFFNYPVEKATLQLNDPGFFIFGTIIISSVTVLE